MTLEEAISRLTALYEWAKKQEYINNPLAYALYHIWRAADRGEENDT